MAMAGLARASSRVPGRKARPLAAAGRPPGRIALPTRVDIVERGRRRPGLGPGGAVTVAGQRRNGLVTSPASLPGTLPGNLARYRGGPAVSLMLLVER